MARSFDLGPGISYGYTGPDTTQPPTASWIATPDGSWAEITLTADHDGRHQVTEGGPRRPWIVENAHQHWSDLGKPGWDRFGLTITREQQTVFVDHPGTGTRTSVATLPTTP